MGATIRPSYTGPRTASSELTWAVVMGCLATEVKRSVSEP